MGTLLIYYYNVNDVKVVKQIDDIIWIILTGPLYLWLKN